LAGLFGMELLTYFATYSGVKWEASCKFVFGGNGVLRGTIMDDCWVHYIYSNTPTEGEFNKLFANLKKDRGVARIFPHESRTIDFFLSFLLHGPNSILRS
jgi:hypothetical protein